MAFKNSSGIKPFENRIWLSSPTKHKEEMEYVTEAFESNWKSTVGKNICVVDDKALCPVFDSSEEWVQAYKEQFGEEPSFF